MRSSNAAVVLQTLVPQAQEIFKLLAQAQLAPDANEEGSEGVSLCSRLSPDAIWGTFTNSANRRTALHRCR